MGIRKLGAAALAAAGLLAFAACSNDSGSGGDGGQSLRILATTNDKPALDPAVEAGVRGDRPSLAQRAHRRGDRTAARPDRGRRAYQVLRDRTAAAAWQRFGGHALTTRTGCALALQFGIAPEAERAAVGARLAELVRAAGGRIATGFLGTPLVLPALTATGHHDDAYRLLLNERCPGWLYQVRQCATTVWERWDAIREDGSIHNGQMADDDGEMMLSFNHYAYGAVASWLYRTVAGIAPSLDEPGYRKVVFAPVPGGGLTWAHAEMRTGYGRAAIRWERDGDRLAVDLSVPPGAHGELVVPPGWRAPASTSLETGDHRVVPDAG